MVGWSSCQPILPLYYIEDCLILDLFTLNACCTIVTIFFNPFSWHVKNLPSQRILCESMNNELPVRHRNNMADMAAFIKSKQEFVSFH